MATMISSDDQFFVTGEPVTDFEKAYVAVYKRVLVIFVIAATLLLTWQTRVFILNKPLMVLSEPTKPVIIPEADAASVIARATNRQAKYVLDLESGHILEWNDGAERLLGWSAKDIVGKSPDFVVPDLHWLEYYHKDLLDPVVRENLLSKALHVTCPAVTSSGTKRLIHLRLWGWESSEGAYYLICEMEDLNSIVDIPSSGWSLPGSGG